MKKRCTLALAGVLTIATSFGCADRGDASPAEQPAGSAAATGPGDTGPRSDMAYHEDLPPAEDPADSEPVGNDLDSLRAAVEQNDDDAEAHRKLGTALRRAGQTDAALRHLERAAELAPEDEGVLLSLGIAYSGLGRLDEAQAAYERILAVSPEQAKALNNLGNIALRRGDEDGAIDWYRRAVEADPDYLLARYRLAGVLKYYGHYEEAYKAFDEVVKSSNDSRGEQALAINSLYNLASINLSWQEYELAEQQLASVVRSQPMHRSAHYSLAQVLFQLGRPEEAQEQLVAHMNVLARTGEGF